MAIRDDLAGRSFELREPFKVVEPLPAVGDAAGAAARGEPRRTATAPPGS